MGTNCMENNYKCALIICNEYFNQGMAQRENSTELNRTEHSITFFITQLSSVCMELKSTAVNYIYICNNWTSHADIKPIVFASELKTMNSFKQ